MQRICEYLVEINTSLKHSDLNLLNQIFLIFFLIQIYFKAEDDKFEQLFPKFSGKLKLYLCTHNEGGQTPRVIKGPGVKKGRGAEVGKLFSSFHQSGNRRIKSLVRTGFPHKTSCLI